MMPFTFGSVERASRMASQSGRAALGDGFEEAYKRKELVVLEYELVSRQMNAQPKLYSFSRLLWPRMKIG